MVCEASGGRADAVTARKWLNGRGLGLTSSVTINGSANSPRTYSDGVNRTLQMYDEAANVTSTANEAANVLASGESGYAKSGQERDGNGYWALDGER
jgi:hypothetical protein